ncbi:unnamed protein product, partial [Amoebophrya sp. A25]
AFVVSGTIAENVRMGRDWLSDEDVKIALDKACLIPLPGSVNAPNIKANVPALEQREDGQMAQPLTLETEIGEGGVTLSGGQQQRLNLARAWAGNPAILVADDPLSAVDHTTATKIFRNLRGDTNKTNDASSLKFVLLCLSQQPMVD